MFINRALLYSTSVAALMAGAATPAFTPASLFANGEQGAWYDPSDLTTMWTDTAGTTQASVNDAIARIDDKSGNGHHATQATAAARPILRQSGSLYYLEFDGAGDELSVPGGFSAADMDFFIGVDPGADSAWMGVSSDPGGSGFVVAEDGNTSASYFGNTGTPSIFVDGSSIGTTRDNLHDAATGAAHVVEYQGLNLSSFGGGALLGNFTSAGFDLDGNIYSIVYSESLTSDELDETRSYVAAKSGVTL